VHLFVRVRPLLFLLFVLPLFAGCSSDSSSSAPPNIVFILADDMGYGDVGAYNDNSRIPTPHIDRLATQGMRFTDAHAAAAVCVPSRYGLLTGRHPHRVRTQDWRERPLIDAQRTTLASALRDRGYTTYMVGKWHLGFENDDGYDCSRPLRGGPVDRGFDHYFGIPASLDQPPYFYIRDDRCVEAPTDTTTGNQSDAEQWTDIQGAFWRSGDKAPGFEHEAVLPRFEREARSYLNTHREKRAREPLFLYMALAAPHTPWLPPDSLRGTSEAGLYGDFVRQVDETVGRVLETLDRLDMRDNTLVVFSSDNGPVWYQADVERFGHRATDRFRGMKSDAWEGGHRVPFLARWPGRIPENTTSDQLLSFTDLLSTFADVGGPSLAGESTDGINMQPVLTAERDSVERDGAVFQGVYYKAVRDGPWKLIPGLGSGGFISTPNTRPPGPGEPDGQLYHLGNDPGEQNNLYDERPAVVDRLTEQLRRYRRQEPESTDE
jgi:arylsulfatase A-like enzyme